MSSLLANISLAATLEKYKLSSGEPWFALVDITWPDGSHLRLCQNTDDVSFDAQDGAGAQTYTAFSFQFEALEEKSDGSIPKWSVRCSNINRAVEALLEQYSGGVGGAITVYAVNGSNLNAEPEVALYFTIMSSSSNAQWVTFTLGAPSPLRILHPRHVYTPNRCMWVFKGPECGYTGGLGSCSLRLDGTNGCRAHGNQQRFGAFPGVDSNGIRVVSVR